MNRAGDPLRLGFGQFGLLSDEVLVDVPDPDFEPAAEVPLFERDLPSTLSEADRAFAGGQLAVHSVLFGLIGADDRIPAYRLSHDSRLPGMSLRRTWCEPVSAVLAAHRGVIVDLRSESYAALGPIPDRPDAVAVRVVSEAGDGRRRALSHFNKKAKGVFARAMIRAGLIHTEVGSLLDWAAASGFRLSAAGPGVLELVVDADVAARITADGMPGLDGVSGPDRQP